MKIKFDDLEMAFEYVSGGEMLDAQAYLDRTNGEIIYVSDDMDEEELPAVDLGDDSRFLPVPDKRELDLGQELVRRFVRQYLPDERDHVAEIFRQRGAYGRYKDLLERRHALQQWYDYEAAETRAALLAWCAENAIEVSAGSVPVPPPAHR